MLTFSTNSACYVLMYSYRTTVTLGRAIRRLVTLYESLDDLLQAADDYACNENEENDDEEELLTEEALEKQQEYANVYMIFSCLSQRFIGLRVDSRPSKFSYRYFHQLEKQLKIPLPIWISI